MSGTNQTPYKDVRSLVRGLRLIETLSHRGWTKLGDLSESTEIERSSVYRLVNTLIQLGYVARRSEDGAVALTPHFGYLADALKDDDIVTQLSWPSLVELSKEILWPCDFASFDGGKILIRLSTHKISPLSIHRGMVGKERFLVRSALGIAILSAMSTQELHATLAMIDELGGINSDDVKDRTHIDKILCGVRERGYASSVGQTESKISAIALPVRTPQLTTAGAINIVFFRSAMTTEQAATRYLPKLQNCVGQVERALLEHLERHANPS